MTGIADAGFWTWFAFFGAILFKYTLGSKKSQEIEHFFFTVLDRLGLLDTTLVYKRLC